MLVAVDLGSNSFRLNIGHYNGESIKVTQSAREPIRFAAGLDDEGNLTPDAMRNALACLNQFREIIQANFVDEVRVVATNTFRIAKNIAEFLPLAEAAIGYPIEVISGEEEGRLIYMGVAHSLGSAKEKRLVVDIGGGSTEIILGRGAEIAQLESFSVGTVKHSLTFFPCGQLNTVHFDAAILAVRSLLEDAAPNYLSENWKNAYGSSGTMRTISDALSKNSFGNTEITLEKLLALKTYCIEKGEIDRLDLIGIRPDRAAMVIGGLAILIGIFEELKIQSLQTIEAGLRVGVMWDLYLRSTKRDRRDQAVNDFMGLFRINVTRANQVAEMASLLYERLKPSSTNLVKHLYWSALLHEIGMVISHTGYHKHGSYMVENADIAGFTTREQKLISKLVLSQKGNLKKIGDDLLDLDFAKAVLTLRLSVMFMHSRVGFDYANFNVRMKNKIELEVKKEWMNFHPTLGFLLQKEMEYWNLVGMDFVVIEKN
jgi:exopolyphosphatase/guanosine-5'-triphosphate,3'-diphosphate pyrophosphatase